MAEKIRARLHINFRKSSWPEGTSCNLSTTFFALDTTLLAASFIPIGQEQLRAFSTSVASTNELPSSNINRTSSLSTGSAPTGTSAVAAALAAVATSALIRVESETSSHHIWAVAYT